MALMDVSAVPERAKSALTHKLGPLPVWGWGALGIGALVLVRVLGTRRGASGSAGATVGPLPPNALSGGGGGGGGGDGSVPNPSPSAPSTTSPNPLFPFRSHPLIPVPAPSTPADSTPPSAPATPATPSAGGTPVGSGPQKYFDVISGTWFTSKTLPAPYVAPIGSAAYDPLGAEIGKQQGFMSYQDWYRKYVLGGGA